MYPLEAPHPVQTPQQMCHSERSRPTFSSAFAPANASACGVEESLFSSSSVIFRAVVIHFAARASRRLFVL